MNTLITGALNCTDSQLESIRSLGCKILLVKDERVPLKEDVSGIETVVCNSLFLYNDISAFSRLRFIQLTSAGTDRIPLVYTAARNIRVANAAGVYSIPISEWAVLKVLELYKASRRFFEAQNLSIWRKERGILELSGRRAAIMGFGSVGQETARRLRSFGVYIVAVDNREMSPEEKSLADEIRFPDEADSILETSDMVILSLPLTEKTRDFMSRERIFRMKRGSVIINLARGGLLDEDALAEALREGILYGAALDVFREEPLPVNSPLWKMENVIITPHNSFLSDRTNKRLFDLIYSNLKKEIGKCKEEE
jgi:phosphoglycerate dehydrogenase-like enzyme